MKNKNKNKYKYNDDTYIKNSFIKQLNNNTSVLLCYGEKNGISNPMGQFIVKDLQIKKDVKTGKAYIEEITLVKVDDENVEVILPGSAWEKCRSISVENAKKLDLESNSEKSVKGIKEFIEEELYKDKSSEHFTEAETLSLEECGANYFINGELQSSNYSICPIDLGILRERIRERDKGVDR